MLLAYSIYLVRAVVSAMVAVFLLFVRRRIYVQTKYRYAHVGVAVAAIMDCLMDVWGCWLIANGFNHLDFHWFWAFTMWNGPFSVFVPLSCLKANTAFSGSLH